MVAKYKGGGMHLETMTVAEIEAHRKRSRARDDGPWVTDWAAMAKKTLVRVGFKMLPKTPEIIRGAQLDADADLGQTGAVDADFTVDETPEGEPKSKTDE